MFKLIANAEIEQIRIEVRESTDQKLTEIYENIKEMAKFGFQVVNYSQNYCTDFVHFDLVLIKVSRLHTYSYRV